MLVKPPAVLAGTATAAALILAEPSAGPVQVVILGA